MASKLNSEFNYRYQTIGETPWEKIKTLQGFLVGRKRAAVLEQVNGMKYDAKRLEVQHLKSIGALPHVTMALEAEIMEIESSLQDAHNAYRLNEDEIVILEKLLSELYAEAEPTRLPGYTDEQMFEANAANEFTVMICRDIQSEILANGRPSPAKLRNAMSNPLTITTLMQMGLIPESAHVTIPILNFNIAPLLVENTHETVSPSCFAE